MQPAKFAFGAADFVTFFFHRTQDRNKQEALLSEALKTQKYRRPTRPSYGAVKKRLKKKTERGEVKKLRGRFGVLIKGEPGGV